MKYRHVRKSNSSSTLRQSSGADSSKIFESLLLVRPSRRELIGSSEINNPDASCHQVFPSTVYCFKDDIQRHTFQYKLL